MTSKTQLIDEAFSRLGIVPDEQELESVEIIRGQREMYKMLARWNSGGYAPPYEESDNPADDLGAPLHSEEAITASLAIILHGIYKNGTPIDPGLASESVQALKELKRFYSGPFRKQFPPTLARGSGSGCWGRRRSQFFHDPNRDNVVGANNDIILDDDGTPLEAE